MNRAPALPLRSSTRRILATITTFAFAFASLVPGVAFGEGRSMILATTTSVRDSGLLDALLPASTCGTLAEAAAAAHAGCEATEAMEAKRGRAKYVEGAGVGHVDAGATSVAELLKLFAGGAAA